MNNDILILKEGGRILHAVTERNVKELTIPETVESIERKALENCKYLREIIIPESVKEIGKLAFHNCSSLKNIVIPKSVIKISDSICEGCSSLLKLELPEGVETIGNKAFMVCYSLGEITLPITLRKIGEKAFYECRSIKAINIPDGVTTLGKECFHNCSSISNIFIPNSIEYIGNLSFAGCKNLEHVYLSILDPQKILIGEKIFDKRSENRRVLFVPVRKLYMNLPLSDHFVIKETGNNQKEKKRSGEQESLVSVESIESDKVRQLIIEIMAGDPIKNNPHRYLWSKVTKIKDSVEYNQLLEKLKSYWTHKELISERGWTLYEIETFLGKQYFDFYTLAEKHKREFSDLEHYQSILNRLRTVTDFKLYKKQIVLGIEGSNDFIEDRRVYSELKENYWTEAQLLQKGFTDYTIKRFLSDKDCIVQRNIKFYYKDRIEEISNSIEFKKFCKMRDVHSAMIELYLSDEMTLEEFLEEIRFNIPEINKETLKNKASMSYNKVQKYEATNSSNVPNGVCLAYLRHEQTSYETISKIVDKKIGSTRIYHWFDDEEIDLEHYVESPHYMVKEAYNNAIIEKYPWIGYQL